MRGNIGLYLEKYSWALNIFLIIVLAYVAARTTNTYARSAYGPGNGEVQGWTPPQVASAANENQFPVDVSAIEQRNLFGAKVREEVVQESTEVVEVPVNLCIQGLIVGPKWKYATMQSLDTKQSKVYAVGDEVAAGSTVYDILADKVLLLKSNGRIDEVTLDFGPTRCQAGSAAAPSGPSRPGVSFPTPPQGIPRPGGEPPMGPGGEGVQAVSETEFVIDRAEFDAQMGNLNDLVTKARIVPNFTPDRQVDGFRIFQIVPGSIFQKLGLRNGDVIQRVNGIKMDDPTKGLELFQALKNQSHFTIDLKRHSQPMTMTYDVR